MDFETAKHKFLTNHKMDDDYPNTFPHVIKNSIKHVVTSFGVLKEDMLSYLVDNGQQVEEKGWLYNRK